MTCFLIFWNKLVIQVILLVLLFGVLLTTGTFFVIFQADLMRLNDLCAIPSWNEDKTSSSSAATIARRRRQQQQRREHVHKFLYFQELMDLFHKEQVRRLQTERKHAHKLHTSVESHKDFLRYFSHELRVPFNVIATNIHSLINEMKDNDGCRHRRRMSDHEVSQYLQDMAGQSVSITKILDQVLDLQKVEDGFQISVMEPFNITNMLNTTMNSYQRVSTQKSLHFSSSCMDLNRIVSVAYPQMNPVLGVPYLFATSSDSGTGGGDEGDKKKVEGKRSMNHAWLRCDGFEIQRVVSNLLSNAVKFSKRAGRIHLELKYANFRPDVMQGVDDQQRPFKTVGSVDVIVSIQDNGPGIPPEKMEHLFERYQRTRSKRVSGSSGLGLYLSQCVVKAHGGNITCESRLEEGTTFTFCINMSVELARQTLPPLPTSPRTTVPPITIPNIHDTIPLLHAGDREEQQQQQQQEEEEDTHVLRTIAHLTPTTTYPAVNLASSSSSSSSVAIAAAAAAAVLTPSASQIKLPGSTVSPVLATRASRTPSSSSSSSLLSTPSSSLVASPRLRILIVEDHIVTQKLYNRCLTRENHIVTVANDGFECIKLFGLTSVQDWTQHDDTLYHAAIAHSPFDMIMMDGTMPVMDGRQATLFLRSAGFKLRIVAVTGNADPAEQASFREAGADEVILKGSSSLPTLLALIKTHT